MNQLSQLSPDQVRKKLGLEPLPGEGGFFRETYLQKNSNDSPPSATAIYYMITGDNFSAWHKVPHDEIFHFYGGEPVDLHIIDAQGDLQVITLGNDLLRGEVPQHTVPAESWQALRIRNPNSSSSWSLMGTTMTPGFEFSTFVLGDRSDLTDSYPAHRQIIEELTRE